MTTAKKDRAHYIAHGKQLHADGVACPYTTASADSWQKRATLEGWKLAANDAFGAAPDAGDSVDDEDTPETRAYGLRLLAEAGEPRPDWTTDDEWHAACDAVGRVVNLDDPSAEPPRATGGPVVIENVRLYWDKLTPPCVDQHGPVRFNATATIAPDSKQAEREIMRMATENAARPENRIARAHNLVAVQARMPLHNPLVWPEPVAGRPVLPVDVRARTVNAQRARVLRKRGELVRFSHYTQTGKARYLWLMQK